MRPLLLLALVATAPALAGCGLTGGDAAYAGVSSDDARKQADAEAREVEKEHKTPVEFAELRKHKNRDGEEAWIAVYADPDGEYEDLCVWVNEEEVESDDCPGWGGVGHAVAREESLKEAKKRGKEEGIEFKFVELREGKGEQGKAAWEAVFDGGTANPDLCVWTQVDPADKEKLLITSDDCP